ncbi:MAG: hypothetical protein ACOVOW_11625, partial [Spirosomataceae bacterium]
MKTVISLTLILVIFSKNCKAQIQPKVLWEHSIYGFSSVNIRDFPSSSIWLKSSTKGNTVIKYYYNTQYTDKTPAYGDGLAVINNNGKLKWELSNYLKNPTTPTRSIHPNYVVISNSLALADSAFLFNNNFDFVRSFDTKSSSTSYMLEFDSGLIQCDLQNKITKF